MEKLTDEELSRVLTAHEEDEFRKGGSYYGNRKTRGGAGLGCLMQVAKADKSAPYRKEGLLPEAGWFDRYYQSSWSSDKFLQELEEVGIA